MPKSKAYTRNPDVPADVNDCLELLLDRLPTVPNNCWPQMRSEVSKSWTDEDRATAIAWCTNGETEPDCVYKLRQGFARTQGLDPSALRRLT